MCECRGRILGRYTIYLPPDAFLTESIVNYKTCENLHGGVQLKLSIVLQQYWVPRLRQLTKRVIRGCYGCKTFQNRQKTDFDFAGPIGYKLETKKEGKAYILLFASSLNRAVHLKLLPKRTAEESIEHLNWFLTIKGHPGRFIRITGTLLVPQ